MSTDPRLLRTEGFAEIGRIVEANATLLTERWARRAAIESQRSKQVPHEVLKDHFTSLLVSLGRSLAAESSESTHQHEPVARIHGEQRWDAGWSVSEVVQDYQILRLVVLEFLEETLDRPVHFREHMALSLFVDDAIASSVGTYARDRDQQLRDIKRERLHAENHARAAISRWEQMFEHAGWGAISLSFEELHVEVANEAFAIMLGLERSQVLGRCLTDFVPPDQGQAFRDEVKWAADQGRRQFECNFLRLDGKQFPVFCDLNLVKAEGEAFPFWAVNIQDIGQRKTLERSLVEQTAALQVADRNKDEFLATLAHELRNPLSPILHAVEVLDLQEHENSAIRQTKDVVERQVKQIGRIVDDLLDLTRISTGKLELRKEWIDFAGVVAQAIQTSGPLIEACGHQLSVSLPTEPMRLQADPARLVQVICNLLNNAAKYTDRGGQITLVGQLEDSKAVVRVRDTGQGLSSEMLNCVFDMFQQAGVAGRRSRGGLGIGLTLVRSLVELHGGSVRAESDGRGRGSEFIVELPVGDELLADTSASDVAASQGTARVLLVEDSPDTRLLLGELLQLSGHEVQIAEDGIQGLQLAQQWRPDVALVDIGLPGLDGYSVAKAVRATPGCENVLLIALTGYGQPEDRRLALDAGFNAHLVKPVRLEELSRLISERTLS